jgi:hypothetical protein
MLMALRKIAGRTKPGPKTAAGRARSLANLKRGGQPGRAPGVPNLATVEIKALTSKLLLEDPAWIESARRRMIAGQATHLEMFFLAHKYGRPKAVEHAPDRPPIVFTSAHGQPGDYDPLARPESAERAAGAPLPPEGPRK